MWYLLALLSAIFASVRRANEKQLTHKLNHYTIGWVVQLLALPVLFTATTLFGTFLNPFKLGPGFWLPTIALWIGFYPLNQFLYMSALKRGELSKILPLQSISPVLSLLLGWLLLGQRPSIYTAGCIIVIVCGIYILNMRGRALHNPLHMFSRDKANLYSLGSINLVVIAGVLDAVAIHASEPVYYSLASTVGAVAVLFAMARFRHVSDKAAIRQYFRPLAIAGLLFGATYICYMLALNSGPLAYVTAIRSSGSVLVGAIIGMTQLRENVTRNKLLGLGLVMIGSIMLSIS